ncbi:DUF5977 domain-containing protein [Chryseobacterium gregarium]|uniref:DUF5977 domain-containing protein n=1 Tax=Chryseobacterium gregarium TaxID=456299 RepID=UPI00040A4C0D|nr:DUF5977 domain-containing protein [Chryseobacterium gregarium]
MKKLKLITIILLLISIIFKSQTLEDNILQKKVQTSNSNNIGKVDLSIPLYDITAPGYSFSASLEYLQNRLISEPQKLETTIAGSNWNLNLMGKIVISNASLQNVTSPQRLNLTPNGFFSEQYDNCLIPQTISSVSKKQILENPNSNLTTFEPNIFYFDFMGNKGYFVYDNVGNFLVNSESDVFQIIYNGSKCHNVFSPINEFPEIIMKDSKGNQFYFGGDYNSININFFKTRYDYNRSYDNGTFVQNEQFFTNKHVNYLSTLYLKKIKLANNKTIDFFYKNSNKSALDSFTNGGFYVNADYNANANIPSNTVLINNNIFLEGVGGSSSTDTGGTTNWTHTSTSTNTYTKFAVLDSIKVSDVATVNFSYDQLSSTSTKPFLKKIELKSNNKIIKKVNFDYLVNNKHVFLRAFTTNDQLYSFEYYSYNPDDDKGGLLKKIIYPTKGWDEFMYEGHNASKEYKTYIGYNESEAIVNYDPPTSVIGDRIKRIITYNNANTLALIKSYNYDGDNGLSSGVKSSTSVQYSKVTEEIEGKEKTEYYFTDIITNPDSIATKKYTDNPNVNLNQALNNKLPIKVSKSTERGKIYRIKRSNSGNMVVFIQEIKYTNFLNNANPIKIFTPNCNDCKITDDKYYVQASKVQYEPSIGGSTPYYLGFYQYQPVLPYLPSSIITREILDFNPNIPGSTPAFFESQKFMKYNTSALYWHPNVIETTEYLPYPWDLLGSGPQYTGRKILTKTYYAQDLIRNTYCVSGTCPPDTDAVGGKFSIYKYMADNNILTPIITAETNAKGKSKLLEYQYVKNASSSNLLQLGSVRKSLLNSVFTLNTPSSAVVEEKETYQLYDNAGNLLQSKNNTEISSTTLYGYKQSLPIVTIKGMTYGQNMQAFNLAPNDPNSYLQLEIVKKSDLDKDNVSENNFISELNNFRNKAELKGFEITSYVYDPLIGVKTVIHPSGVKDNYTYDSLNRLEKMLDTEGNILKEYKYNIPYTQHFNAVQSKPFTKNNCPPGTTPGPPITYTVPPSTYTSIISVEDANQKALDDIALNGQNYANANGTCNSYVCTITPSSLADIYYSSFQEISVGHIKAILSLPLTNTSGGAAPNWSNGVFIGTLGTLCIPSSYKNIYVTASGGGSWLVSMSNTGMVFLTSTGGASPSGGTTLYFEYDKN